MWGNIMLLKKLKNTTKKDFNDVTFAFDEVKKNANNVGKYFVTEETEEISEKTTCTGK